MEECVELSVRVAQQIAEKYSIPVYLYEHSARFAARQDLAYVRKGEFEGLREEIRTNPERKPDFGPSEVHVSAGAIAVGARFPLIAYNVYLNSPEVKIAQAIARAVRYSSGGLRYVKALGFEIKERNQTQVSMNLTNYEGTPVFRAFEMVRREAQRFGVPVVCSEIVGLVPQNALDACAAFYLQLENFTPRQVLENRLEEALSAESKVPMEEFLASIASTDPVPGGGSVAALAGALAAALGEMVAGLTEGRKKFEAVESEVKESHSSLSRARSALFDLVSEDAAAYKAVLEALRLPKETAEQKEFRERALEQATRRATESPLRTARAAAEVLALLEKMAVLGNPNARSDAAAGAQLAFAALKAAQYNVLINVPGLKDRAFAESCRSEADALVQKAAGALRRIDSLMLENNKS
jgi:glutamate formiminotransferase/formiminotetrahydrofolate cyclodeaminase